MATTERFYVSTKDNRIRNVVDNPRQYFMEGGKHEGKAKYIIEVFGDNHKHTAMKVRDMVDNSGMTNELFTIKVETR